MQVIFVYFLNPSRSIILVIVGYNIALFLSRDVGWGNKEGQGSFLMGLFLCLYHIFLQLVAK